MKTFIEAGGYGAVLLALGVLLGGAVDAEAAKKADRNKGRDAEPKGAAIVFPAKGNLDPNQGSVEALFSLSYSFGDQMVPADQSSALCFPVMAVHDSKGVRYHVYRDTKKDRKGERQCFYVAFSQLRRVDHLVLASSWFESPRQYDEPVRHITFGVAEGKEPCLKAGEWHTLAVTWQRSGSDYALAMYLDGKSVRAAKVAVNPALMDGDFDPAELLCIGYPGQTYGALQNLRISKRARTAAEIAAAEKTGLVKDADTLLFIDADVVSKLKTDRIEDLINKDERTIRVPPAGLLFGKVDIVEGRSGKAIRFQK